MDYRTALAKIRQERSDVGKALTAAQVNLGSDLKKKGEAIGTGQTAGSFLGPILGDYLIGGFLNLVAPGLGATYQAAKSSPILKALGTGLYSYGGSKIGAEVGDRLSGDVRDATPMVEDYLGDTISGTQAMRFDRGASEALDLQKDEQLKLLDDLIDTEALGSGASSFLKSITGDVISGMGDKYQDSLDAISATRELTGGDYVDALTKASGEKGSVFKDIFDISPIFTIADEPGKATNITSAMMTDTLNYEKLLSDLSKVRGGN